MLKKISIILTLLLLKFSLLNAEVVNEIIIDGNKRVSDETIKIYGDIEIGKNYLEKDLNSIINKIYSTLFFENVEIELKNNIMKISLKEYPIVSQLLIIGEKSNKFKEQIKSLISTKEKKSFINSNIAKDIEIIKSLYSSAGYNFSNIDIKVKKLNEENLDVVIQVERGNKSKISSISFIGEKIIRDRRLRDVIASEENKFWKFLTRNTSFSEQLVNLDIRLLSNYYKSLGYYDVEISSNFAELKIDGDINLIYSINAGTRYTIEKISTNADPVFDKKLFFPLNEIYKKYIGEYYSPFKVKKMLEEIDEIISNNNLQFVEHNVEEIVKKNSIDIKFNISEGEKILVERIDIKGNNITKEDVIRGELILDEGDPFTNLDLEKSIANLKSRNIFKTVSSKITEGASKDLKVIDASAVSLARENKIPIIISSIFENGNLFKICKNNDGIFTIVS